MSNIAKTVLAILFVFGCCQFSYGQAATQTTPSQGNASEPVLPGDSEAVKQDIRKLLKLTGADKIAKQMVSEMVKMQRRASPGVPAEFWDEFEKDAKPQDLLELSVPSYAKHLTHEEIKGLIKFYKSPLGKRLVEVQPMIVQESMIAGQKWGMKIGREAAEKMKAGGF